MQFNRDVASAEYDSIVAKAESILAQHNPCEFQVNDGVASCIWTRQTGGWGHGETISDCCCGGCEHHSATEGCTVKAVGCKFWLCSVAERNTPSVVIALSELRRSVKLQGNYVQSFGQYYRQSKEQVLDSFARKENAA